MVSVLENSSFNTSNFVSVSARIQLLFSNRDTDIFANKTNIDLGLILSFIRPKSILIPNLYNKARLRGTLGPASTAAHLDTFILCTTTCCSLRF